MSDDGGSWDLGQNKQINNHGVERAAGHGLSAFTRYVRATFLLHLSYSAGRRSLTKLTDGIAHLPSQKIPTKRPNVFKRFSDRCFKSSSKASSPHTPIVRESRFATRETPIRRPSDSGSSTTSCDYSCESGASSSAESSTGYYNYNGPHGEGFEIPVVSVLDPAGDVIHGHGGDWGDFDEREPIGTGAGQIRTIREKMELARKARGAGGQSRRNRPTRPVICILPAPIAPQQVAQPTA